MQIGRHLHIFATAIWQLSLDRLKLPPQLKFLVGEKEGALGLDQRIYVSISINWLQKLVSYYIQELIRDTFVRRSIIWF
jgi:hypothetical protein